MDVNAITQLVGTLGFPIVACAALFWQNTKTQESNAQTQEKVTEALNAVTVAVTKMEKSIQMLIHEVNEKEKDHD